MKQIASKRPFSEVLRTHVTPVGLGVCGLASTPGFNGLFFAHMAAYMSGVLGYDQRQAVISQTIGVIVHAIAILAVGRLVGAGPPRALIRVGSIALPALALH